MSCILRKDQLEEEIKLLKENNFELIEFKENTLHITYNFYTKDETETMYLKLKMTKNLDNKKPFEVEILENILSERIDLNYLINSFLSKFYWEEGGVLLSDFFIL